MASDVTVAPAAASTSVELASTIAAGMLFSAGSLIPTVSFWLRTVTSVMTPPETVTKTLTSPPIPCATPSYVPSAVCASAMPAMLSSIASAKTTERSLRIIFILYFLLRVFSLTLRSAYLIGNLLSISRIFHSDVKYTTFGKSVAFPSSFSKNEIGGKTCGG